MDGQNLTVTENNSRVRMNVSLSAKGLAQWDITAEFDSAEKSAEELGKAIDLCRDVIASKGILEAKA